MKKRLAYKSIRSAKTYDDFLGALYIKAKRKVEEVDLPPVQVLSVHGNEPPASKQYQDAIAVLYGIGYTLKFGLKFGNIVRPKAYFDYKVGALETFWWSVGKTLEINNPKTLRWQAYLMVPPFVSKKLVDRARQPAREKHPDLPYDKASLEVVDEGRSVQILHVGPYYQEQPTIDELHRYIADHGLAVKGRHHEIYISDPRRTKPEKLKTVIRLAVEGVSPKPRRAERRREA
jgi:hypothetical protein